MNRRLLGVMLLVGLGLGHLAAASQSPEKAEIGGYVSPDGSCRAICQLPVDLRTRNRGGSDGAGLCVFSSIGHAARWQNDSGLWDLQKFMWSRPGGGYPEKVQQMVEECSPRSRYLQYLGSDPTVLEVALRTGRMPSVTYNSNHMVSLVFLNEKWACVLDNNYVGENELRWHSRDEFLRLWRAGSGGWAVVLLNPRPPAPPRN